jgi:hypothetical protein
MPKNLMVATIFSSPALTDSLWRVFYGGGGGLLTARFA